jgi:hypothetical protein
MPAAPSHALLALSALIGELDTLRDHQATRVDTAEPLRNEAVKAARAVARWWAMWAG